MRVSRSVSVLRCSVLACTLIKAVMSRADHPTAANLTNLLRPEFVKQFAFPLCSDAFSNFTDGTHNGEIAGATEQLQWDIIPRVGRDLPNVRPGFCVQLVVRLLVTFFLL